MKPTLLTLTLAITLNGFFLGQLSSQEHGSIRGTVLDENGTPLAGAQVIASPVGGWTIARFAGQVSTDSEGRFSIEGLAFGQYGIFAMKEEALYPNTSSSFYSDNLFTTATVSPASPSKEVRVHLQPKAGVLTGSVTSSLNGSPLAAAFKFTRVASPNEWLSTSLTPEYRVLIPSSTDVLLEVSASGFRAWTPGHAIRLEPGRELHLDISLEPSHDPGLHASKFLVPEGYVGWLLLDYNVKQPDGPNENCAKTFKFPSSGSLSTCCPGPDRGAEDEYFYYSPDGSLRAISMDYRAGKGMVWGQHEGARNGMLSQFGFFVGTAEQYNKSRTRAIHPGPVQPPQQAARPQ